MRQMLCVLWFVGKAVPDEATSEVLVVTATTPSCATGPTIACGDPTGAAGLDVGGAVTLETEMVFTGDTTFQEQGLLAFGESTDLLRFSTLGSGYLGPTPDATLRQGAMMRRVSGGEGRFKGVGGLIVSTVSIGDGNVVTEYDLGLLHVP